MFTYEMRPSLITSPSMQLVVERVALHRDSSRIADEAHELGHLLLRPARRAGGLKDLLAYHGPLHVVGAEVQCELRHRHPHHDPVRLDVRDVVEHEAADG